MINKIFSEAERLEKEYKGLLRDMVNIESYSYDKADVDRLGRFIKDFAEEKGFTVKVCPFEKAGDGLVISMNDGAPLPPAVFTAHMDTVHKKGSYKGLFRDEGDVLYGPGVIDCKGGIAIALLAMTALKNAGFTARPVKLIAVSDEEIDQRLSGKAGGDFIRDNSRGAAAALTLENNPNPGYLIISRKGSIRFKVNVHGKAATASERKKDGINAIMEAAYKIIEIENTAPGPESDIIFNCGLVSGGVAENMVPDKACFVLAVKYRLPEQRDAIIKHVERVVNKTFVPGSRSDYEITAERPTMYETAANRGLGEYVSLVSQKYGWGEILPYRASAGTDAAYTSQAGVPSVCGLGAVGINGHTVNELMYADSLLKRAKLAAACVFDMPDDFCAEKYDKQG